MKRSALILIFIQLSYFCMAQFSVETGVPSLLEGFNSGFTRVGVYTKLSYRHKKLDYAVLGSTSSFSNDGVKDYSLGVSSEYLLSFKQMESLLLKPGLMAMYTRNTFNHNPLYNNKVCAVGPSLGVELRLHKGLSMLIQAAPLYGVQNYDRGLGFNQPTVYHFPIMFSLGLKYQFVTE